MLKTLQRKFVLLTTSISVSVLFLIAIIFNIANYLSVASQWDAVLNLLVENNLHFGERFLPHDSFDRELAFITRFFVVGTDLENNIQYIDTKNIGSVTPEEAVLYAQSLQENSQKTGIVDNYRYVKMENENGILYLFLDIEGALRTLQTSSLFSFIIAFVASVLIFVLACLLSKKAVAPIAYSYERQKGFITNVSHDFKTPLAIIKANTDVLELDHGESEWTGGIKTQITKLDGLVENLVSLTKIEEEPKSLVKTEFSLSDALRETACEFSSSLQNEELSLTCSIVENISYKGNELYIRRLFSLLLENAIKYSTSGEEINISLYSKGHRKVLCIENTCENVQVGAHPEWFERFFREDKARNSESKGFGIGLSVAKSICDLHGAKISAESKTEKNVAITVLF